MEQLLEIDSYWLVSRLKLVVRFEKAFFYSKSLTELKKLSVEQSLKHTARVMHRGCTMTNL